MAAVVLIVEDSGVGDALMEILGFEGFIGVRAFNGGQGLQLALERHPDIIFTDLMLPEMNGIEFIKRARSNPAIADIPIVMMSAAVNRRDEGLAAGADMFLEKPFLQAEFWNAIKHLVPG